MCDGIALSCIYAIDHTTPSVTRANPREAWVPQLLRSRLGSRFVGLGAESVSDTGIGIGSHLVRLGGRIL
jgi:hypothetical protein